MQAILTIEETNQAPIEQTNVEPTIEELWDAIKQTKNGKDAGHDGIETEMMKI